MPPAYSRDERALGTLGVTYFDEVPEPERKACGLRDAAREWVEREPRRPHHRVGRDIGEAVIEGRLSVFALEPRRQVHETDERRQASKPAAAATGYTEIQASAEGVHPARIGVDECDRRLREDERDVALESVPQPHALVLDCIVRRAEIDQNGVAVELDREPAQLIRPLVERPTGREIKAGMVPVTREDPVTYRSAMKGESHVRTSIVDRMHLVAVHEHAHHVPIEVDYEPPGFAQVRERCGGHESFGQNGSHCAPPRRAV